MRGALAAPLCVVALGPLGAAQAQHLLKCVSPEGKTSYQSEPCAAVGRQEQLRMEPSTDSGRAANAPKAGWNRTEIHHMSETCIEANFWYGRREFDSHPHPPNVIFYETDLAPSVSSHCYCLALRASTRWTFEEYSRNPLSFTSKLTDEALGGGACKPDGKHAELLRKTGRMQ